MTCSKVIIIEHNKEIANIISSFVMSKDEERFQVMGTAYDAQSGYRLMLEKKPDIVLVSLFLPDIDGATFIKSVKENPLLQNVTCIAMSPVSEQSVIKKTLSCGASAYLLKPFLRESLFYSLEKCVSYQS